eukprot:1158724-Pelagomonas_calceolata.AAC.1
MVGMVSFEEENREHVQQHGGDGRKERTEKKDGKLNYLRQNRGNCIGSGAQRRTSNEDEKGYVSCIPARFPWSYSATRQRS